MGRRTDRGKIIPFSRRPPPKPDWFAAYARFWAERLDQLTAYLAHIQAEEMPQMPKTKGNDHEEPAMSVSVAIGDPADDATTLVITRVLQAPRALVWKMFSDPYHLAQWWGPQGYTNRVEKLDFRTGGSWLHVMIGPDGTELPTDNDIVEVTEPHRIVFRNAPADPRIFGDNPPPGFTKTLTFDEVEGGTRLTLVCSFDKPEHKDAVVRRGFSLGTNQSFDKLQAHLREIS